MASVKVVSPKAELAVLRGMCSRDKKIAGTLIANVDENYFYSPESLEIYHAIIRNMGVEGRSPSYRLMIEDPDISTEARDHFRDSVASIQTVSDANKATKILNRYRQKRGLFNLAAFVGDQLKSSKIDIDLVLHKTATALNVVRSKKSTDESFIHFGKNNSSMGLVNSILDDDNSEDTIPTGIEAFDEVSGGLARGALFTIGANSGGGKSVMASALAKNMAQRGYKVVLVPLEMSKREMTCRIMANVTNTDLTDIIQQRLATGEKELVRKRFKRWLKKVKEKGGRYTIFKPDEDMTIEEVMASVNAYDCDVVIIDYISLLKGVDGDDQVRALGQVARYAKINAENNHRVNILLCQVNDEGKIKYARAISEHSANCWIWMANKETKETGITKIEQPKSRNSLSFPFLVKILYAKMQIKKVDLDDNDALSSIEEKEGREKEGKKGSKKSKSLPNLASDV